MESELYSMRREMDELRNAVKDKTVENLDGMTWRTYSPFTIEILNCPLTPKFRLPQLESYDSLKDPLDHIESFKTLMHLRMTSDEVMCRAFPTTLKGVARVRFSKIPLGTIVNFEQLKARLFRRLHCTERQFCELWFQDCVFNSADFCDFENEIFYCFFSIARLEQLGCR